MIRHDHVLACGHRVTTWGAATTPTLVAAQRRHARTCQPIPSLVRRFAEGEQCLLGHEKTVDTVYTDEHNVDWCRLCARLAQNGVMA